MITLDKALDRDMEHETRRRSAPEEFRRAHPKWESRWDSYHYSPKGTLAVRLVRGPGELLADDGVESRFRALADTWHEETLLYSFIERKAMHHAYQAIIGMGPRVVPIILRELENEPDHWFWALEAITLQNPVDTPASMDEAAGAWIAWGRERGLI